MCCKYQIQTCQSADIQLLVLQMIVKMKKARKEMAENEYERKIAKFIMEVGNADLDDEEEQIYDAFTNTKGFKIIQIKDLIGLFNLLKIIANNSDFGSKHILIKHYGIKKDSVTAREIVQMAQIVKSVEPVPDVNDKTGKRHVYELWKNNIRYRVVIDVNKKSKSGVLISFYTNRK